MKGELRRMLEMHGFAAAGHAAGNMPMSDWLSYTWSVYQESNGNMFVNPCDKNRVFTAPKTLVKTRNYTGQVDLQGS